MCCNLHLETGSKYCLNYSVYTFHHGLSTLCVFNDKEAQVIYAKYRKIHVSEHSNTAPNTPIHIITKIADVPVIVNGEL